MILHTDTVTESDIRNAAHELGLRVVQLNTLGSRSHARKFDVLLSGSSTRNVNFHDFKGATFDEWGFFLNALYAIDETMVVGNVYFSSEHFDWATALRFANGPLSADEQHKQHRWNYAGTSAGGAYRMQQCDCGAMTRICSRKDLPLIFETA